MGPSATSSRCRGGVHEVTNDEWMGENRHPQPVLPAG